MIAEQLIQQITKMPRVLLVEPAGEVAEQLKSTMEQGFNCTVDWKTDDDQIEFDGLAKYDIIFVDAGTELIEQLLEHLRQCAPYTPVVLVGETRHPQKGVLTICPDSKTDLAALDEVFGKFKLRVKRLRPEAACKLPPSLFS